MGILGYNDDMLRYDKENRGMNLLLANSNRKNAQVSMKIPII